MQYLICSLLVIFFNSKMVCASNTIIIKKRNRPSNTLLDKKIIYLKQEQAISQKVNASLASFAKPQIAQPTSSTSFETKQKPKLKIKKIEEKKFNIQKPKTKELLSSLKLDLKKNLRPKNTVNNNNSIGIYQEDDWQAYTQETNIENFRELHVHAKIKRQ